MYVVLRLKQLYVHVKTLLSTELGYSNDGTAHIFEADVALEQKYDLGDHPLAVDAVYFNGTAKDGSAVITGIARRPEHYVDAFMYLKVNDEELLLSSELPDTRIKQSQEETGRYKVGGIHLSNVIPMRTWKVAYNGEMK
ncbi:hypothetical protein O0L34_g4848 [Tuta absoluta]|nr:hypothetical protein O0L34_g4848 [Tuta absoluta]